MDGVKVSHDALLPGAQGLAGPFGCLNSARFVTFIHYVSPLYKELKLDIK